MSDPVSVAVLGSGLAGLATAHLLSIQRDNKTGRPVFDVQIVERAATIGLDAATFVLPLGRRIETPMRAAQGGFYARLLSLYKHLEIETRTIDFDYCIARGRDPVLIYEGANALRWNPVSKPANQSRLEFAEKILSIALAYIYVTLWSAWYWLNGAYADIDHNLHRTTFKDWCRRRFVPDVFCERVLFPLFAAVCTSSIATVEQTPAADTLEYIFRTFGARHYLSDMSLVVQALLKPIDQSRIHLSFDVAHLQRTDNGLILHAKDGRTLEVEHVISCTPSSVTARLSRSLAKSLEASGRPCETEYARAQLLSRFPTRQATVVNHCDPSVLPFDERDRRTLNLSLPGKAEGRDQHVSGTHVISPGLYQTTNPRDALDPTLVLSEATFERAICTLDSRRALGELWSGEMQGHNRLWLAGSWASKGIPLLEACVSSAERVVGRLCQSRGLDYAVPW